MSEPHFSKAADKNKDAILERLRGRLAPGAEVLEIASGTGQHALHFASSMPDVIWQPSDCDLDVYGLRHRLEIRASANLHMPIILDVARWPSFDRDYDAVYSANCIHVMPLANLAPYVEGAARSLKSGGMMMLYGPFKYDGAFTTQSNAEFDAFLRGSYDGGGIRDFEAVDELAQTSGLALLEDVDMPANNQFIIWQKA
ncbi:MAG: DUF938 domain-containing protein [Ahrensia sp.]|nr:DUF938 domain-containing protein [Ahrensia sp.]